jgi:hypothetical protein
MTPVIHRHPSRLVPLALASVLVLGACGADDDGTAGDTVPSATDASLLAPRPVRTAGGGAAGSTVSASAEAAPSADGRMATDMMMPYRIVTFVPGDGLPSLPTNDVGYLFVGGATATAEQVAALAAGLGVEGEPVRTDDGYSVYWRVGPDDGTAPSVYLYEDAQLSWSYGAAWATQSVSAGCAIAEPGVAVDAVSGDAATSDVAVETPAEPPVVEESCVEPEPPANVPTPAEAESLTTDLMTAVGLDPSSFDFETYGDEWFASVSAVEQLDGAFAARRFDAGFGAEGALQYASGQLAQPERVGPYPLVDLDTAIARLNDTSGFYGGFGGGMLDARMADVAVASDAEATAVGGGEAGSEPSVGAPVSIEPMPVESMPPATVAPEEVTVTLVDVQADVWWAYDVDGSVWLLPAYRFIGDDGGWYVVPAVTDEYLVQVPAEEVPVPEPAPLPEPLPVETIVADTKLETVPTESIPGEPALFDTVPLEPSIGKTLAEFTADAEALGATVRVAEIAGVPQPVTLDFNTARVNVAVDGEGDTAIVTAILNVG